MDEALKKQKDAEAKKAKAAEEKLAAQKIANEDERKKALA